MERVLFFYNTKKKCLGVVDSESYRTMRPDSLATHGLGLSVTIKVYERPQTELERRFYKFMKRAQVFFYSDLEYIRSEEIKAGVPDVQIAQLLEICERLKFNKSGHEIEQAENT